MKGGRTLERLAGPARGASGGRAARVPMRWRTQRAGSNPWAESEELADHPRLRGRRASLVREGLQQSLLFPLTRFVTSPTVYGAGDLVHAPQPAVIAPNHSSDVDTPLVLWALPRAWRTRTVVGAASDRFYARRRSALMAGLWINTFPFDRSGGLHGLGAASAHLRAGRNVLLYPQATRTSGLEGFRAGVGRLCVATGAPVLPVHVSGTGTIMPKDRGVTRRGRAEVRFGRAVEPLPGEDPHEFTQRMGEAITALVPSRHGRGRARG